jgi:hypothetical protein
VKPTVERKTLPSIRMKTRVQNSRFHQASLGVVAFLIFLLNPSNGSGAQCEECAPVRTASVKLQTDLQSHESLLQRNRDYLARLDPSESSKAIKVKSNIVILAVRIETIKNNLVAAQSDLQAKGCDQCPIN